VAEIDRRLGVLRVHFDIDGLAGNGGSAATIRRYYEQSRLGYRLVHSDEGAMHMALNPDGHFDRAGYQGQARMIEARLPAATTDVLELACGNGYNLRLLASRLPHVRFLGVDLVRKQIGRANRALARATNARAAVGDFQDLDVADGAFDCIFVIESLCHATDLARAFGEARRVLRPGGRFVVIDAWRTDGFDSLPANVRQAAAAVEGAMAVADAKQLSAWKRIASGSGLRVTEEVNLTDQIKPNLERLARIAETRLLAHPRRSRILEQIVPSNLLTNAVAGFLMPWTVASHAHTYRLLMLEHAC